MVDNQLLLFFKMFAESWFAYYIENTTNLQLYQPRLSPTLVVQMPPPIPWTVLDIWW